MNQSASPPLWRRLAALLLLTLITALWAGAVALDWWQQRLAPDWFRDGAALLGPDPLSALPARRALHLGGADSARAWVRALAPLVGSETPMLQEVLQVALAQRPLWGPLWLDQAELLAASGDREGALRRIALARALWPERDLLWQRAAWMQVRIDPTDQALTALLDYWALVPGDGQRTLALARRLAGDAPTLLAAAEPVWQRTPDTALTYQRALMQFARQAGDQVLAAGLWARLDDAARADTGVLLPYLQLLVADGEHALADALWQATAGAPVGLVNGDFEAPIVPLGRDFRPGWATPGWRLRASGEGFRIGFDPHRARVGARSLRIDFDGSANVDFNQLSQVFRVRPGQHYRLRGYWAAQGLTTRSGVFIELATLQTRPAVRVRTPARWGSWDWEPFELELAVPPDGLRAQVQVRRAPTRALDRLLAGSLWLDDLSLTPVERDCASPPSNCNGDGL